MFHNWKLATWGHIGGVERHLKPFGRQGGMRHSNRVQFKPPRLIIGQGKTATLSGSKFRVHNWAGKRLQSCLVERRDASFKPHRLIIRQGKTATLCSSKFRVQNWTDKDCNPVQSEGGTTAILCRETTAISCSSNPPG